MTKDQLENTFYERMSAENEAFLADLRVKPADEIISHAYEIACRDNLLMLFEDETSLSERQLTVLNEFEHPLSQLYTDWLSRDTDEMDAFRDSIACCADDILRKRVEEKYQDPAQPIYPNTRSEAMARGEAFEWMASRDRTLTCAGTFEKDATNAYNDGKLPAFLKEWTAAFPRNGTAGSSISFPNSRNRRPHISRACARSWADCLEVRDEVFREPAREDRHAGSRRHRRTYRAASVPAFVRAGPPSPLYHL